MVKDEKAAVIEYFISIANEYGCKCTLKNSLSCRHIAIIDDAIPLPGRKYVSLAWGSINDDCTFYVAEQFNNGIEIDITDDAECRKAIKSLIDGLKEGGRLK